MSELCPRLADGGEKGKRSAGTQDITGLLCRELNEENYFV